MAVETVTPPEFIGNVLRDFDSRRGKIIGQDMRGQSVVVRAHVPLASMFGYVSELGRKTTGRATYTMQYDHYALVPRNIADGPDNFPPAVGMRA